MMTDDELSLEIKQICRGADDIVPMDALRKKLARSKETGKPLRIKLGIDPTAPHLHLGHTVPLGIFRRFQEAGHQGVIIIGDYTARVGDPSGKSEMRPQLSDQQVEDNVKMYLKYLSKVIDVEKAEIHHNGDWFSKMTYLEVMKLTSRMTVAQMLERDDFNKRYNSGTAIGLHEFMYPLMQGWDSVMIKADVELGGTEQLFNLNVGRQLQKEEKQEAQVCITLPILIGTDGTRRMGKSLGNYIAVDEEPNNMFGKIMSIPDNLIENYYTLLTEVPLESVKDMHPRDSKVKLAKTIISFFHNEQAAEDAETQFTQVFKENKLPDDIAELTVDSSQLKDGKIWIAKLISLAGFAKSNGEGKRLAEGGGVYINQEKVKGAIDIEIKNGDILQVGKRKFAKINLD